MNKQIQLKVFMDFNKMKKLENLSQGTKLISVEDRRKGFSIVIEVGENIQRKKDYMLYCLVHDKDNFDKFYRDIWATSVNLNEFSSLNSLVKQLSRGLKKMDKYLEEFEGFEGY